MNKLKFRLNFGKVAIAAVIAAMFVWLVMTVAAMNRNYDLQNQLEQGKLENEIQEIENENLKLQQAYYQTNEYLELAAREKLNKVLPGENLVILPKTDKPTKVETGIAAHPADDRSNFEKWVELLLGTQSD
jgi:cell division protein FtsL